MGGDCYGDVLIEAMALAPIQPSAFEVLAHGAHTVHVPRELHARAVGDGHPFALFDIATNAADRIASAAPALGIEVGYECNQESVEERPELLALLLRSFNKVVEQKDQLGPALLPGGGDQPRVRARPDGCEMAEKHAELCESFLTPLEGERDAAGDWDDDGERDGSPADIDCCAHV